MLVARHYSYTKAIQYHISLAKSKSKELESSFHALKLCSLRLSLIVEKAKHLKKLGSGSELA